MEALLVLGAAEKSGAISLAALNKKVLLNIAPSVIQLVTAVTNHLRHAG